MPYDTCNCGNCAAGVRDRECHCTVGTGATGRRLGAAAALLCSAGSRARAQAQLNIRTGRGVTTSGRAQQTISLDWMDGCDAAGDIDGLDRLVPCVRGTCQYGAEVSALHVWNIIVEEFRVCSYIYVLYSYP